jgi:Zn-dependent protease/predicted transcriptional regulator
MTDHAFHLGRIHGVDIYIHWSWLIIFVLFTWTIATAFLPLLYPRWSVGTYWIAGAVSSLILFASVLLHELSHSFVAQSEGIPVSAITLFVFGGVSNIQREPRTARDEFFMAIAGPAMSLFLGILAYGLLVALRPQLSGPVRGVLFAVAFYNVVLAIFNMLPGFPLDGGRVFRSIVWGITHNFQKATRVAIAVGHVVAFFFIFLGLFIALSGDVLGGLWLVFIGWFLNSAASMSQREASMENWLGRERVRKVMRTPPPEVPADTTLDRFVEDYVLAQNQRAVPVVTPDNHLAGLITLNQLREVPREEWSARTVEDAMIPAGRVTVATPDEPLIEALRDFSSRDVNQIPVIDHGEVVGLLTRADLLHYLHIRQDLDQTAA